MRVSAVFISEKPIGIVQCFMKIPRTEHINFQTSNDLLFVCITGYLKSFRRQYFILLQPTKPNHTTLPEEREWRSTDKRRCDTGIAPETAEVAVFLEDLL